MESIENFFSPPIFCNYQQSDLRGGFMLEKIGSYKDMGEKGQEEKRWPVI